MWERELVISRSIYISFKKWVPEGNSFEAFTGHRSKEIRGIGAFADKGAVELVIERGVIYSFEVKFLETNSQLLMKSLAVRLFENFASIG